MSTPDPAPMTAATPSKRRRNAIARAGLFAVAVFAGLPATGLSTASTFDADSYVYFGTSNAFEPALSVGVDLSGVGVYHFTFGVVRFDDLSGFGPAGDKSLRLDVQAYAITDIIEGFPVTTLSPSGSGTLKLVALDASYDDYLLSADKPAWFDTHIGSAPADATASFAGTGGVTIDVTDAVNAWLAGSAPNHGFALVLTAGDPVELGASEGVNGPLLSDQAAALPGDTDGDGDVDDADLGTSFANYTGPVGEAGNQSPGQGDTDSDGDVDDADLGVSFANYTGPTAPAVPEPAGALLLGALSLAMLRRRRD